MRHKNGRVRPDSDRSLEAAVADYESGNYFSALPILLESYASDSSAVDLAVMILDSYIQLGEQTQGWGFLSANPTGWTVQKYVS